MFYQVKTLSKEEIKATGGNFANKHSSCIPSALVTATDLQESIFIFHYKRNTID
jgi:hypothetical protein